MISLASIKLSDVFSPKNIGESQNPHITRFAAEPRPDYDAMMRLILGAQTESQEPHCVEPERNISEKR